jgi:uncharacterized membrane protein
MAIWIAGFSLFSFLPQDSRLHAFYPLMKTSYGRVCHQQPDKSFLINGSHFLVCSRCTGIYLGGFIALLFSFFSITKYFRTTFRYFVIFSLLMFVDVLINNFILVEYNKTSAFFTGYLFSFFAVYFVIFEIKRNNFFQRSQRNTNL